VPRERVLFACSHSHSSPVTHGALAAMYGLEGAEAEAVARYAPSFLEQSFRAAQTAMQDLGPARLSFGQGEAFFALTPPKKARKIIKKIGLELFEDPEFKPTTIEPLKMQGIDSLGDSGLLLRMKVMTLPGQQFTLKRRALRMIHQAFNENGIKLAVPTVQVSGGKDDAVAAAAQQTLAAHNAAAAATPA
jgi:hypothetical protein